MRALFILMASLFMLLSASHSFAQSHPLPVKSEGVSTNTPLGGKFRFPIPPAFRTGIPHIKTMGPPTPPVAPSMAHSNSAPPGSPVVPSTPHIIHVPSTQRFVSPSFENRRPLTRIGKHQIHQPSSNHGRLERLHPITTAMPWSKQKNPMDNFMKHDSPFSPIFTSSPFNKNLERNFHKDHFFKRNFFANLFSPFAYYPLAFPYLYYSQTYYTEPSYSSPPVYDEEPVYKEEQALLETSDFYSIKGESPSYQELRSDLQQYLEQINRAQLLQNIDQAVSFFEFNQFYTQLGLPKPEPTPLK